MPHLSRRNRNRPLPMVDTSMATPPIDLKEDCLDNISKVLLNIINRETLEVLQDCFRKYLPSYFDRVSWKQVREVYLSLNTSEWLSKIIWLFSILEEDLEQTCKSHEAAPIEEFEQLIALLFPFLTIKSRKQLILDLIKNIKQKPGDLYQIKWVIESGHSLNKISLHEEQKFLALCLDKLENTLAALYRSSRYNNNRENYGVIIDNLNALKLYLRQYENRFYQTRSDYLQFFGIAILVMIVYNMIDKIFGFRAHRVLPFSLSISEAGVIFALLITLYRVHRRGDRIPEAKYHFDSMAMEASSKYVSFKQTKKLPIAPPSDNYFNGFSNMPLCLDERHHKAKKKRTHIKPLRKFLIECCKRQIYTVEYSFELMELMISFDSFNKKTEITARLRARETEGIFLIGFINDTKKTEETLKYGMKMVIPKIIIYLPNNILEQLKHQNKEKKVENVFSECSNNKNRIVALAGTELVYKQGYRYKIKIGSEDFRIYAKAAIEGSIVKINGKAQQIDKDQKTDNAKLLCFDYIDWHPH